MSVLGKRIQLWAIGVLAVLMVVLVLGTALSKTPSREITLVVRGMAFYLSTDPRTPNPTLEMKAGERVRIVVRNADPGMTHDFAIPALKDEIDPIKWNESDEVVISAPEKPGTYNYECRPHRLMMHGNIRVH